VTGGVNWDSIVFFTAVECGHHSVAPISVFGVQFWHFSHFFLKSNEVSILFSKIGILHLLGLCTLINPFFARLDVSHPKI